MDRNYPGREMKPDAITRKGKLINFWLSPRDLARFESLKKSMQMSGSDVLRFLINNEYLSNQEENEKFLKPKM